MRYLTVLLVVFAVSFICQDSVDASRRSKLKANDRKRYFELILPVRNDFLANMMLSTYFPRKFMYTLKDYEASKQQSEAVLHLPNALLGSIYLGRVHVEGGKDLQKLLSIAESLAKRVFRTGLNEHTAGGLFRLPLSGLVFEERPGMERFLYAKIDLNFASDSAHRYAVFVRSLFQRLKKSKLRYEIASDVLLDRLIIGQAESIEAIDLKSFKKCFSERFLGFATVNKLIVKLEDDYVGGDKDEEPLLNDRATSYFYFDHVNHDPIIGVENVLEE